MRAGAAAVLLLLCAACQRDDPNAGPDAGRIASARGFPRADPVAASNDPDTSEAVRDRNAEAARVMDMAGIREGMRVADIGAGEGYYTVRLSPRVGRKGRVLAEDIDRATLARLGDRVSRDQLDNVAITQGDAADPRLPPASFDRVLLIHVLHEVGEPYAFLWHLGPALRSGGRIVVVELDRPLAQHGMPPALLFCEFGAVGFRLSQFVRKPELSLYYAEFEVAGVHPEPSAIRICHDMGHADRGAG